MTAEVYIWYHILIKGKKFQEWINRETANDAAFTGSMQLLAGVRLSTFRPLTNHPHFEDKELRARTKEVSKLMAYSFIVLFPFWKISSGTSTHYRHIFDFLSYSSIKSMRRSLLPKCTRS